MSDAGLNAAQKGILRDAMLAAGRVILEVREAGNHHTIKNDGSPVTEADTRAEVILLKALHEAAPGIIVVAEEAAEAGNVPPATREFFLVDPLDGTKEFIKGGTDFTVNIGLVRDGNPVFGLIYVPASGRFYEGEVGQGASVADIDCQACERFAETPTTPISVRSADPQSLMAVASRSHRDEQTNAWLAKHQVKDTVSAGSSLKFCVLAEGQADVYPRFGPTMEWDTAAGHAILAAAGGRVETFDGKTFFYGKSDQARPYLNPGFIAFGGGKTEARSRKGVHMRGLELRVNKNDIRVSEIVEVETQADLEDGEILLAVDKFALTANNITYAATGHTIGYWKFFPISEPWGIVPVWGFADVIASKVTDIKVGERIYGFLPFSSHVRMRPGRIKAHSFVDVAEHRADLPPIYNDYIRVGTKQHSDPRAEDIQALFQPLFATSFLLHDFFNEQDCFGAKTIILGSASSKTAMGIARLFAQEDKSDKTIIGLTSSGNIEFVRSLGTYDEVVAYESVKSLQNDQSAIYIDMAGNTTVKRQLHAHFQDRMVYSCAVGLSHWDRFEDAGPMPGAKPVFFFAPDQALKRRKQWGGAVLQTRISTALGAWAADGMGWLNIVHGNGTDDALRIFDEIRDGNVSPDTGYMVSLKR